VLTPFQERIAAIVAGLDEADDFALAGGGALIIRGDVDRGTRDLDFFGLTIESVDRLAPAVERALTRAGMEIVTLQSNQGFVRLVASQGDERCEIDLAADARLFPIDTGPGIPTLTGEELAVDKVLAISDVPKRGTSSTSLLWSRSTASSGSVNWPLKRIGDSPPKYSARCSTDLTAFNDGSLRSMMSAFSNLAR
jgi:Nucleotidyl transferase AbiEii toxin, Type IV TA system